MIYCLSYVSNIIFTIIVIYFFKNSIKEIKNISDISYYENMTLLSSYFEVKYFLNIGCGDGSTGKEIKPILKYDEGIWILI